MRASQNEERLANRRSFMELKDSKYGGMTVNERLYGAGLLEQFDAAVRSKNRNVMLKLLNDFNIPVDDAAVMVEKILANQRS
jgi:hypothetical protein